MDTIILICCTVNFVLQIVVLIRLLKPNRDTYFG